MAFKSSMKLMKVADEFADFDLLKPKDRPSPRFQTRETESMFIISVYLKGYRRTDIKVERNEDGSRIMVSGESPVQDKLMVGGKVVRKDIEMQRFQKSFKIPEGVVLGKVKAMFNEDDSELVIRMPKAKKGLTGFWIEEVKTTETPPESAELLQIYANGELSEQENQEIEEENVQRLAENMREGGLEEHEPRLENDLELNGTKGQFSHDKQDRENLKQEYVATNHSSGKDDDINSQEPKSSRRKFKICTPTILYVSHRVDFPLGPIRKTRKTTKENK